MPILSRRKIRTGAFALMLSALCAIATFSTASNGDLYGTPDAEAWTPVDPYKAPFYFYSYGPDAGSCENGFGKIVDPMGILFHGRSASAGRVEDHIRKHLNWGHGGWTDQRARIYHSDGTYHCDPDNTAVSNASELAMSSRSHIRLWYVAGTPFSSTKCDEWTPRPLGCGKERLTVGTPHFDQWNEWYPGQYCISENKEYEAWCLERRCGTEVTNGSHAVPASISIPAKFGAPTTGSGFDYVKYQIAYRMGKSGAHHNLEYEKWGNNEVIPQCNGEKSGSNGQGVLIGVNHPAGGAASASNVGTTSMQANGSISTEEAESVEYWFGYGLKPQEEQEYPFKTAVATTPSTIGDTAVSRSLTSLAPGTRYYMSLFMRYGDGEVDMSNEVQAKTCAPLAEDDDQAPGPRTIAQCNRTVDVFYRTPEGKLGHNWFDTGGLGWLSGDLPASIAVNAIPRAVGQSNGTIDVFYRTASGGLGHNWFDTGGAGWLSGNLPGSVASDPHAVVQGNGTVDVFYRTASGGLGHNWFDTGGAGWLSGNLPGAVASDPHAVVQGNGTIDVFYRTPTNELGHDWFDTGGSGWHSGNLPGSVGSEPHAVVQPNGTIDVFYRTASGGLGHNWFDTGGAGWLSGNLPGSVASEPHAVVQANGTVDVFYRTPTGGLGHNWFDTGGLGWQSGNLPGTLASDPHVLVQGNGTVDVFYRTPTGELGHNWFDTGGAGWLSGNLSANMASDPHAVIQSNGTIDVFYRTTEGRLGHNWFDTGGMGWASGDLPASIAARPPVVSATSSSVAATRAKLEGTINPEGSPTTYYFEYGPTTAYGTKAPTSPLSLGYGTSAVSVSQLPSGLSPNTTYHYRIVAESPEGVSKGTDKTFTTGSQEFSGWKSWGTWSTSYSAAVADLNGDGKADLAGRNSSGGDRRVGLSTGTTFGTASSWGTWSTDNSFNWQLADANGDGKADTVGRNDANGEVRVGLSTGSTFSASVPWTTWSTSYSLNFADVNGDGRDDIVGRNSSGGDRRVGLSTGTAFAAATSWGAWSTDNSLTWQLADVNGDGKADSVGRNEANGEVRVGLSTGTTFSASVPWTTWSTAYSLTFADVNGDGREDLVGRSSGGDIQVGLSIGSSFAASKSWGYLDPSYTRIMGDVNGDGRADVIGWNSSTGAIQVGISTSLPGPVASYSFNEGAGSTLHDSSGKHEGAISNGATWTTGKYGSALHFDGIDDLVTIPAAADLKFGNDFTLEAWVRPDELRPWVTVLSKDAPGYELNSEGGYEAPRGAVASSSTNNYVVNATSANRLPALTWSHLALTSDGSYIRLYVNGTQVGTGSAGAVYAAEGLTRIGGNPLTSDYLKGAIDDVRLYNRTLTVSEIAKDKETAVG